MKPKPYTIASGAMLAGSCVLKITYDGKKYVIVKCKEAYGSLKRIENSLNAFIRGGVNNPEGLYVHLYNYVKKNPHRDFKVEILLESENCYHLLKQEQIELDRGKSNKAFLNNQVFAYIPPYNDVTRAYGWIPPHAVLNFNNWLERTKAARKPAKKLSKA
jgi:hypothetical protein